MQKIESKEVKKMTKIDVENLKLAMINAGVGTTKLAEMAGVAYCSISLILKGNSNVRLPTISKLAKALNVDPKFLLSK